MVIFFTHKTIETANKGSVLAGSWCIAKQCKLGQQLCGDSPEEESKIQQWVEFYCTRMRPRALWEQIPQDKLLSAVAVQ